MENYVYIYTLTDPITNQVRYVGKTKNLKQRRHNHLNKCLDKNTHKRNWINSLRKIEKRPIMEVIEEVLESEWHFWEKYWIAQFRHWGFNLVNYGCGGEGLTHGNQTSFKKGHIPWNHDTGHKKCCTICKEIFYSRPSDIGKYCSRKCFTVFQKSEPNKTQFKKGFIPWNKNKSGYRNKSKQVLQFDLENNFIQEYSGCKEASLAMGCIPENIRACCVGKSKTAMKFIWKYKN